MIIKGDARTGPEVLGPYLTTSEANERIQVFETRGTVETDVVGALKEMDAYAAGSRCQKPLYHVKISPEPPYRLTPEQIAETLDAIEEKFGFTGPRVAVIHEKNGREHIHAVWTRIDPETMKAVSLSFNYRKHEEIARDLERRFGHPRVQGVHAERDGEQRPDRSATRNELAQEERTGISRKAVKEQITELFRTSDGPKAFREAVEEKGYIIANGDRRDFVVVDHAGGVHSLPKMIDGMRTAQLRDFMKPIQADSLPTVEMACEAQADRAQGRTSRLDEMRWEDTLRTQGVVRDQREANDHREKAERFRTEAIKWEAEQKRIRKNEATRFQESAIKWEAEQKRLRDQRRAARAQAKREKRYGQGDGYVNQSRAVLKEHRRRQKILQKIPKPLHPDDHKSKSVQAGFRDSAQFATGNNPNRQAENLPDPTKDRSYGPTIERRDYNEEADRRYKAMRITLYGEDGYEKSYFADEARLRREEARERKEKEAEHRRTFDKPHGQSENRRDYNEIADQRYKAMRVTLYGEDGYEKSYFADEARLRHEEEQERKRERAKNAPSAKPLGEKQRGRHIWESDEETRNRMQRLLNEEKWEPRSDDEDLEPDRQQEASGRGRTRSR